MFESISYLIYDFAIAAIVVLFYAYLFQFRFSHKIWLVLPIILMVSVSLWISDFSFKNMVLNFFISFFSFLVSLCFFKYNIKGVLYSFTLYTIMLLTDGFIYYTICLVWGDEKIHLTEVLLFAKITTILFNMAAAYFIAKKFKSIQHLDIPKSYWILLLIIPTSSIISIYIIYTQYQNSRSMLIETWFSILVLFCVIVGSIIIYSGIVDYFNTKLRNQVLSSQLEVFSKRQNTLSKMSREVQRTRHDLKNRLFPITTALREMRVEDVQSALEQIIGEIDDIQDISYTGIEYLDDMLNYKAGIAAQDGIFFHVESDFESRLNFPFMDISAAIGIALDNAIEACQKQDAKKDVFIKFISRAGQFFVYIENDFTGALRRNKNGDILTTKPDSHNHGLGISSIQNLMKKCHGDLKIEAKNGKFVLFLVCEQTA